MKFQFSLYDHFESVVHKYLFKNFSKGPLSVGLKFFMKSCQTFAFQFCSRDQGQPAKMAAINNKVEKNSKTAKLTSPP